MNRRTWKDFLTKRSTIWTLSLCLVGVIVLGSMAAVNNSRNKNSTQPETELGQVAYLEEDLNENSFDAAAESGISADTDDTSETAGSDVSGTIGSNSATDTTGSSDTDADGTADSDDTTDRIDSSDTDADRTADSDGATDTTGSSDTDADGAAVSDGNADVSDAEEASSSGIISEQALIEAGVSFTDDQSILWPCAGTVIIDYSMDKSVYFSTLNQYKYNPALIISSDSGNQVLASARGIVESISIDEETGTTLVLNIGNGYKLTYGQLMEPAVSEGDTVEAGDLLAYISEPTKYYSTEGSNLYFAMTRDGEPVDPVLYLE